MRDAGLAFFAYYAPLLNPTPHSNPEIDLLWKKLCELHVVWWWLGWWLLVVLSG